MGSIYTYKDTSGYYTRGPIMHVTPSVYEGMVADCSAVSRWVRLGFVVLLLAFLLHLIGFTTPAWIQPDPFTDPVVGLRVSGIGLWEVCGVFEYSSFCVYLQKYDNWAYGVQVTSVWHYAVQVLVVVGFVFSLLPIALLILYMIRRNLHRRRVVLIVAIVFSLLAGVAILAAVIVYGLNSENDDLGWSFGLTAAAGALFILGVVPLIVGLIRGDKSPRERLP